MFGRIVPGRGEAGVRSIWESNADTDWKKWTGRNDCLPPNALMFIDESHFSIPQIDGMYKGDRAQGESGQLTWSITGSITDC